MAASKTSSFLGLLAAFLAASAPAAFAQSTWHNVDCSNARITHPALKVCQEGPKTLREGSVVYEAWNTSGNLREGRPAQLNLAVTTTQFRALPNKQDTVLEDELKAFYRSRFGNDIAGADLEENGDLNVLRFERAASGQNCVVFHKWGELFISMFRGVDVGYKNWVRGYLCVPRSETIADAEIEAFIDAAEIR